MNATPDPGGWPALLHRLATSWSTMLRLLFGVAVVVTIITVALHFLGPVTVQIGPFAVEIRQEVTTVLARDQGGARPGPGRSGRHARRLGTATRSRSAATTSSPSNTSAASAWNRPGSV